MVKKTYNFIIFELVDLFNLVNEFLIECRIK